MDRKVTAAVGAVIIVGAAVYGVATGTVLPSVEEITEEEPPETGEGLGSETEDTDDTEEGERDSSETGGVSENETENETHVVTNETENATENVTDTEPEPLPVVCEEQGGDIGRGDVNNVPSAAGPVFDPIFFESMLHDRLNELRAIRSDAEPLKCDPDLREIAREHSELYHLKNGEGDELARGSRSGTIDRIRSLGGRVVNPRGVVRQGNIRIKPAGERYEGVCESPREREGVWLYQRYTDRIRSGDFSSRSSVRSRDQRVAFIADHGDLARDVRGSWANERRFMRTITDEDFSRQGVGVHIDRKTREVVVTHVVC